MGAIYKKELRSYFSSPLGYVFLAVFLAVSGFLFSLYTVQNAVAGSSADLGGYYNMLLFLLCVCLPILTMKSFAEEKKLKTDQLLLTAPVRLSAMVTAKFLSAYTVFAVTYFISCFDYVIFTLYSTTESLIVPDVAILLVGYSVSMLLLGAAFIAIGVFVSSLTENQMVAALASSFILLFMTIINYLCQYIDVDFLRVLLKFFSVTTRFVNFTYGIFDFAALVYYLSITAVFLFLTVRVFEKRRWN